MQITKGVSLFCSFKQSGLSLKRCLSTVSAKSFLKHMDTELESISKEFVNYEGGRIELFKDESSGVATLCINNAERKNAFSGHLMVQMTDVLTELESWKDGKAVLIHGAEQFFCSGGDMTTVKHIANSEGGRKMGVIMQSNLKRLQALPMLTTAVIQGRAIGGGAELTTACDFRLMTPSAKIGYVHINIGITAGWGGGARLVQLIGPAKALELMISGRQLTANQALDIGLINDVLKDCVEQDIDDVLTKSRHWLDQYINGPLEAMRAVKSIVNAAKWFPIDEALHKELDLFASVWGGPAHKAALAKNFKHR